MNILIVVTMIIVFISAFFVFFTGQGMIEAAACEIQPCERGLAATVFGVSTIMSFILISILAVYIVSKTLKSADIGQGKTL